MERLVEAAFKLFVSNGYHATSLEAIASEANLTKGAVYFYFGSKEKLALHLLEVLQQEVAAPLVNAILRSEGGNADKIVRYIHTGAEIGAKRPDQLLFMILMAIEFGRQHSDEIAAGIRALYARIYEALEKVIRTGQESGALAKDMRPREFASMIVAVHDGMMLEWHIRGADINGQELVRNVRKMLLNGIIPG